MTLISTSRILITLSFLALLVENVMDIGGEVSLEDVFRQGEAAGPLRHQCVDIPQAVVAGAEQVFGDTPL